MKFLRKFNEHASYEAEVNVGGQDFEIPNVSYCKNVDDVHFNPYNLIEFYVGEITEPQKVKIYTDGSASIDITVSKGNKWYSYLLPKNKGLFKIEGDSVKKVVVKADININFDTIIPTSTVEASFKGSNTSNVANMAYMFNDCNNLTSLDLSSFNTSKVTNMNNMFQGCNGLTELDVSKFDTSKVTNMNNMFSNCNGLTSLNLSNFDTSKVTNMNNMFQSCSGLTLLDLSSFNTTNVTSMTYMFYYCSGLTSLDLSRFDTSNTTNMNSMFAYCGGLTSLDLSKWDTSNVTNMSQMFKDCGKLKKIKMVGCKQPTIDKIKAQLTTDGISLDNITITTK